MKAKLKDIFHINHLDIDKPLTPETTSLITSLITAELPSDHLTTPHPLLPDLAASSLSPAIQAELDRVDSKIPLTAIDTARYSQLSAPTDSDELPSALQQAFSTSTHLSNRVTNLTLLSTFGQNSWLIGNSQMEGVLAELERELENVKEETNEVNRERKRKQVEVKDELERLEKRWREGVSKVLEVEVASELVFRETLERRRAGTA